MIPSSGKVILSPDTAEKNFAIVLFGVESDIAATLAENIREHVFGLKIPHSTSMVEQLGNGEHRRGILRARAVRKTGKHDCLGGQGPLHSQKPREKSCHPV